MKFLVTGDWHFKGINPAARLDNYQDAIMRKICEVYDLATEHRVKAIIVPGDVFHSPGTALGTITDLAALLQAAPCPVLAVAGNHDLWAGNPGSKYRTPFGLLSRLGMLWDLSAGPFECGQGFNIVVTGHGFTVDTDTEAGMGQYDPPPHNYDRSGISIHVVHSMLLEQRPHFDMRHTLIRDVRTSARVIVTGHGHIGFGVVCREDGVLFVNPGALCRLTAHPAEMKRQVQVALLTVEDGHVYAELIPLKSARPGHEVLNRAHLEAQAEQKEKISQFLNLLSAEGESRFLEIREIVDDIARREKIPSAGRDEALKRLSLAREALGRTA